MVGILEDYLKYLLIYKEKYGDYTVVFYQNGKFFEIYGVDNEEEKFGNVKEIAEMLCITSTRKNTNILENNRSNFLLAGFPCIQLDKYVSKMTEQYNYIVVVVEQTGLNEDGSIKRSLTNVITPGSNIKYLSGYDANNLVCLYIEGIKKKDRLLFSVAMSSLDVSTGICKLSQTWNSFEDENTVSDDVSRFIELTNPKEILLYYINLTEKDINLNLDSIALKHINYKVERKELSDLTYQNQFLKKVYPDISIINPIEYINLSKYPDLVTSFCLLLDFCYDKNELIISRIGVPEILENSSRLILDNSSAEQLNILNTEISKSKNGRDRDRDRDVNERLTSIISLVSHTSTPMGKRYLRERLLSPYVDEKDILKIYDKIDMYRNDNLYLKYEKHLDSINDIERCHRKIYLRILNPSDFNNLKTSYENILSILELENEKDLRQKLSNYLEELNIYLDFSQTSKFNLQDMVQSPFNYGIYKDLDEFEDKIAECEEFADLFSVKLSEILTSKKKDKVELSFQYSDDIGYFIEISESRLSLIKSAGTITILDKKINLSEIKKIYTNKTGKIHKITINHLEEYSEIVKEVRSSFIDRIKKYYQDFLSTIYEKYSNLYNSICDIISKIDYYKSGAKCSLLYNYSRPIISNESNNESYIISEDLRHPLIERFQTSFKYTPQNINFLENRGILLFGVNCSGKSSLMKAIGISVVLAQAGYFVPAKIFKYYPYKSILTRIVGNDNLFKGLSSFAVEMCELRSIIKRANSNVLVLGDEICKGTETLSAVAIVSSTIITLSELRATFLFATHLHHLSELTEVTDKISMFHLSVQYDEKLDTLIYNRKLTEGCGSSLYGLEVARAMNFPENFIIKANQIRKNLSSINPLFPKKKSLYNSHVYLEKCSIPECKREASDTHHIKFQCTADNQGFIDNVHKNHRSNLIPLCKPCHQMVHCTKKDHYKYVIYGLEYSLKGTILKYDKILNN